MNNRILRNFTFLLFFGSLFEAPAQPHPPYRAKQLHEITSGEDAPLWPEDTAQVAFFPVGEDWRVQAEVEFLKGEKPFSMPTFDGSAKEFIRFARLHFTLDGTAYTLTAYKNLSLPAALASLQKTVFIPFKDATNGGDTYGGGRYLDMPIPAGKSHIQLDFNKAYNPYCAYSDGYRCPVPPGENHLQTEIEAGEKSYSGSRRKRGVRP